MKVGSLFSGIGGFELAFQRAGFKLVWSAETDPSCRDVLERHFGVRCYHDVREVRSDTDPVDVVVGGFPCQDVSVAGRRAGLAGDRSGLWWEFHRVLADVTPRWCVIENVPGLLSSNGGRDMGAVLGALGDLGYGFAYRVLDAQFFGLAQRRKRVFIVGCLGDGAGASEVLLEPEGCRGDSPTRRTSRAIAAGELARSLGGVGGGQDYGANKGTLVSSLLSVRRGVPSSEEVSGGQIVAHTLTGEGFDASEDGTGRGTPLVVATLSGGSSPNSAMPGRHHEDDENIVAFDTTQITSEQNRNNPKAGDPCHPLAAGMHAPAIASPAAVRRLTPLECERLQGFPDDWTASQSDSVRYRQLGNAVAVPCVEWIARRLMAADERTADTTEGGQE